jgi:TatD DNase family protein
VIDSHCHLADEAFVVDLADVVDRAKTAGVEAALCILSADEPDEVARAAAVSAAWPAVRFAAAVHPHRAAAYEVRPEDAAKLVEATLAARPLAAIGEIGLDYHYAFAPKPVQRAVFQAQVALAVRRRLPVVIHTREAAEDTMAILRAAGPELTGVLHCFTGTVDEARQGLDLGFFVSLSGILTFPKSVGLKDVARFVPEDRLLVETDAPFLAPVPHRGSRNEPAWVTETLAALAAVRGVAPDVLGASIVRNFRRLVGPAA